MVDSANVAYVYIWDMLVGAVAWDSQKGVGTFEFDPAFIKKGLDLSPIHMSIRETGKTGGRFEFRGLPKKTFMGLPGMLVDALPDNFGNNIINAWLARQGRTPESFSPVERLCYTGKRAMGALEFSPIINQAIEESVPVEIEELVKLAQMVTDERSQLKTSLNNEAVGAMLDIIRVGTSAGGNRPKAVIALCDKTREIRSGQVEAPEGFDHWVLKFDGIKDSKLRDPAGYGRIEYAYYKMALSSGIKMTECRLLEENNRAHFMTRRFDRLKNGKKVHLQTLCALAHFDFNAPGVYSYEQAFQIMRELRLTYMDAEQQFRRMVFNVIARNQDDHTKNISFLLDRDNKWRLSPAYDVVYSYNPDGMWTDKHQMTICGKNDSFTREDFLIVGKEMNIKKAKSIIDEIVSVVSQWPKYAKDAGVEPSQAKKITKTHRFF